MSDQTGEKKKRRWPYVVLVVLVGLLVAGFLGKNALMRQAGLWALQIRSYERADAQRRPKPGGILFIGSSSIRYWKTLSRDMKPLPVLNRGFGGAHVPHVQHYADRILFPYRPKIIVLYVGENDLAAGSSQEEVWGATDALLKQIHAKLPKTHVYYVSVKPSVLRASSWPKMAAFNRMAKAKFKDHPRITYVDITSVMLTDKGKVDPSIFAWDKLHMNAKGYQRWTRVLKPILSRAWSRMQPGAAVQKRPAKAPARPTPAPRRP